MESENKLDLIINDEALDTGVRSVANKIRAGERISDEECLMLFEKADLPSLGIMANYIREKKHGDKVFFNRNFHMEPTNVCLYTCTFCSYSRLIKKRSEGWEYTLDEMMDMVKGYDDQPQPEVH